MNDNTCFKPRVLITGAAGFVGSNLVRHLINLDWEVHILTRPKTNLELLELQLDRISVHEHDGTTDGMIQLVKEADPQIIYHLASLFLAQHKSSDVESLIQSNLLLSTQIAEAMSINGVGYLINTGTSWQHYLNEAYNPVNLYAATKQAAEDILKYYIEARNIKVMTLALFDTYGPSDSRAKLITLLSKAAFSKQQLGMSPGEQCIDLVYIDDVVNAFVKAAEIIVDQRDGYSCYGVASGKPSTVKEVVQTFSSVIGFDLPVVFGERPYREREVMQCWSDYERLPGWTSTTTLQEGLTQIVGGLIKL